MQGREQSYAARFRHPTKLAVDLEMAPFLLNWGEKASKYRRFRHFVLPASNIRMQSATFLHETGQTLMKRIYLQKLQRISATYRG